MWYALTHHWNFARVMRVGIGIMILVQGILNHDYGVIAMGGFFGLFGLFTTGCCGVSGCGVNENKPQQVNSNKATDIIFEEVNN